MLNSILKYKVILYLVLSVLIFLSCIRNKTDLRPPGPLYNYWKPEPLPTYTQEDSLRDHIKRIEYINTIEPFTPYEEIK